MQNRERERADAPRIKAGLDCLQRMRVASARYRARFCNVGYCSILRAAGEPNSDFYHTILTVLSLEKQEPNEQ